MIVGVTSERRDELLLKCDGSSLRLSHSDKDGLGNVLTSGELRELLQAHKELETAIAAMRRATGRRGVWSSCGIRGDCNGEHSRPALPMKDKCDNCRLATLVAAHDARTGAGTAAREGGG